MPERAGTALARNSVRIPLYGQVLGVLRQRINDRFYPEHSQLPPEDRLAAEFAVSRATIRQAVGELVREGLVERRQGRGTFALGRGSLPSSQRLTGYLSDLVVESERPKSFVATIERHASVPESIAEALALETPFASIVRRTRLIEDEPFAYSTNYMPDELGDMLDEAAVHETGPMSALRKRGLVLGSAEQTIRAEQADIVVCERLQMEFAAPVLFVERHVFDRKGKPLLFVRTWYRGDLYEYRVTFTGNAGPDGPPLRLAQESKRPPSGDSVA